MGGKPRSRSNGDSAVLLFYRLLDQRLSFLKRDNGQTTTPGTFNAFFPRGAYLGPTFALIGPANLLSLQSQFVFQLVQNVTGTFEWIWLWRESTHPCRRAAPQLRTHREFGAPMRFLRPLSNASRLPPSARRRPPQPVVIFGSVRIQNDCTFPIRDRMVEVVCFKVTTAKPIIELSIFCHSFDRRF
jgi:hypothetical protein